MIANWSPVSYCRLNKTCQSSWNFMLSKLLAPTMAQQVVNLLPRTSGYTPQSLFSLFLCSLQITAPLPHHNVFIFNCLKTLQIQPLFFYFIWLSYLFWIHCTLFLLSNYHSILSLPSSLSFSLTQSGGGRGGGFSDGGGGGGFGGGFGDSSGGGGGFTSSAAAEEESWD